MSFYLPPRLRTLIVGMTTCFVAVSITRDGLAQVDPPMDARPHLNANEPTTGSVDRFQVDPDSLQRGSFALPTGLSLPMQRAATLLNIFPTYSPGFGYSEWGRGWVSSTFALLRRGRHGAPQFNATDALESQWGLLWPGLNGHYPYGFQGKAVVATVADDTVTVVEPDGTKWTYGGNGRVVMTPGRGVAVWMLASVENLEGDRVTVDEYETSQAVANGPTPGAPGRHYPKTVRWHRWANQPAQAPGESTGILATISSLARRALRFFSSDTSDTRDSALVRLDAPVATATYEYERIPEEHDDYSLGVDRQLDRRVSKISFALRDRRDDEFRIVSTYIPHYDPSSAWFLTGIDEIRGGETQSKAFVYGKTWVQSTAQPELSRVDDARAFPTYPTIDMPAHALSPGEPKLHLVPADIDGDGIADFFGRKGSWFTYSEEYDDHYVEQFPREHASNPDSRCVGLQATPQVIYTKPGSAVPILAVLNSGGRRELTMIQCALDGTLLSERRLALLDLADDPTCRLPLGPEIDGDGNARVVVTDVTSDAIPDVVAFDRCALQVWSGASSSGDFLQLDGCDGGTCGGRVVKVPQLDPTSAHAIFDINGDGLPDIVDRSHQSWLSQGIDASRLLLSGPPNSTLSIDPSGPITCGLGPTVFADVNNDDYIDTVQVCPSSASLTVALGSRRGLKVVKNVGGTVFAGVKSIQAVPLGGMTNPGIALIGTPQQRRTKTEACPPGTRPGSPDSETFFCSPEIQWLTLRHANTGLLTDVYDGKGGHLSLDYEWVGQRPGFPEQRAVLAEIRLMPIGMPQRVEHFSYEVPWRDADTGQWGFLQVRKDTWSGATPDKKTETDLEYKREGRLSWLTSQATYSPSGQTVDRTTFERSVVPIRAVPAVRLDTTTQFSAHNSGPNGLVQRNRQTLTYEPTRPQCVATITVGGGVGNSDSLITTHRRFAEPKLLGGALSCLPMETETIGRHADSKLNFDYTDLVEYNDAGQRAHAQRTHGDQTLEVQRWEYDPNDGGLRSFAEPGRETVFFDYEPAAKMAPTGPKTRLVRTERGGDAVKTSVLRMYEPVRDLLVEADTTSGAASLQEGVWYDDWGRAATWWRSDAGGAAKPWRTARFAPATSNQPARISDVVHLEGESSRNTVTFLDAVGTARATLAEWERFAKQSTWRLVDFNEEDVTAGTMREVKGGVFLPYPLPDAMLYKDVAALGGDAVRSSVETESRDFRDDPLTGTRTEYISPLPVPPGTSPGPTTREWRHTARVQPSGSLTRFAQSSTPHCNPQSGLCSNLFTMSTVDGLGREVELTGMDGLLTKTDYDMLGRIRRIHLPSGRIVAYDYDELGRFSAMTRDGLNVHHRYAGALLSEIETQPTADPTAAEKVALERTSFGNVKSKLFTRGDCGAATRKGCEKERLVWDFETKLNGTNPVSPLPTGARGKGFVRRLTRGVDTISRDEISLSPKYDPEDDSSYSAEPWRRVAKTYTRFSDRSVESVTTEVFQGSASKPMWSIEQKSVLDATGRLSEVWLNGWKYITLKYEDRSTTFTFADNSVGTFGYSDELRSALSTLSLKAADASGNSTGTRGLWADFEQRDSDGRINALSILDNSGGRTLALAYKADQLTGVTEKADKGGAVRHEGYSYDADGLLQVTTLLDGAQHQVTREKGKVSVDGGPSWTLDAFGRPVASGTKTFSWSPRGQIRSVTDGNQMTHYYYDENDERVLSQTGSGSSQELVASVGDLVVTEKGIRYDLIVAGHLFGTIVDDEPISFVAANYDRQNTLRGRSGEPGASVLAYGLRSATESTGVAPEFVGRRFDAHTGMLRLGVRDYIPEIAQFASPDPLFLASAELCRQNPMGCNLFGYAQGNPVEFADPSGLLEQKGDSLLCSQAQDCYQGETISVTIPISVSGLPVGDSAWAVEGPGGGRGSARGGGRSAKPAKPDRWWLRWYSLYDVYELYEAWRSMSVPAIEAPKDNVPAIEAPKDADIWNALEDDPPLPWRSHRFSSEPQQEREVDRPLPDPIELWDGVEDYSSYVQRIEGRFMDRVEAGGSIRP